ncbi:unnamed protein product [Parnassius mnemosyne]|uniref:Endonuclease-reverse transcriptase n=1 Tax=Parnassius mnemosyne TaxID=213953 RepID=A0AAV1KVW6_9NEOP
MDSFNVTIIRDLRITANQLCCCLFKYPTLWRVSLILINYYIKINSVLLGVVRQLTLELSLLNIVFVHGRIQRMLWNVTEWCPRQNKRNKGRQRLRWEDDIRKIAGVTWRRITQDRKVWQVVGEAFAEMQDNQKTSI